MPIEFVTWLNETTFPESRVLLEIYNEEAYNGNSAIYFKSSNGYRYKVTLKRPDEGLWYLSGTIRTEFCNDSLNENVALLHFIEEGDDHFYVTGYTSNGNEVGVYEANRATLSRFMTCVLPYPNLPQLLGDTWNTLVGSLGLEAGTICVLTKNRGNRMWLEVFNNDGSMKTNVVFPGAATLKKKQLPLTKYEKRKLCSFTV
ncbi:hypothetical protein Tco_1047542 [Tanacetum coccineum]